MSAPDTNTQTEKARHRPALLGIRASLVYAAILLMAFYGWTVLRSDGVEGADTQVEVVPGVGAVEEGE